MNPWSLLGLSAEADERSIKRCYAQLLKKHRPDEDAEDFQRLREAYEQAVALARRRDEESQPQAEAFDITPARLQSQADVEADVEAEVARIMPANQQPDAAARVRQLLEAAPSLDEALDQARSERLERDLQLHLLTRCSVLDEQGLAILRWAMARLQWLSPWQADYLSSAHLDGLAERLLVLELQGLRERLHAGEERGLLEAAAALASSEWLRPFDRRLQLQGRLVGLLEEAEHWSPALFDRLGALFDWDEGKDQLPCSRERWYGLCRRCEMQVIRLRLQKHLSEFYPLSAEQKASWLLLKPMDESECRQLVDRFDEADWQVCKTLDDLLNWRYPCLPAQFGVTDTADWRRWQPRSWAAPAAFYAWLLLFGTMLLDISFGMEPQSLVSRGRGMLSQGLESLIASLFLIAFLACMARSWGWLARYLTRPDMSLSRLLLPANCRNQGAGMLVLRHGVPAATFSVLVGWWNHSVLDPWAAGLTVFFACLLFLGQVGCGRSPWPRMGGWKGELFKVDYSKEAEW